jgi:hypothetical protein
VACPCLVCGCVYEYVTMSLLAVQQSYLLCICRGIVHDPVKHVVKYSVCEYNVISMVCSHLCEYRPISLLGAQKYMRAPPLFLAWCGTSLLSTNGVERVCLKAWPTAVSLTPSTFYHHTRLVLAQSTGSRRNLSSPKMEAPKESSPSSII